MADSAADAYAGVQLYHVLDEQRQKLDPCPPRPFYSELKIPIPIPEEVIAESSSEQEDSISNPGTDASASKPSTEVGSRFLDSRVAEADAKMQKYRSGKHSPVSVGPSALRTYYIWYENKDLNPEAIAKLLRDPPLRTYTVTSYILNSIAGEDLPFCKTRMKEDILPLLSPTAASAAKYRAVFESCQDGPAEDDS